MTMAKKAIVKEDKADAGETKEAPSKMQMVRDALADLGGESKPQDIGAWVKAKFGVEIAPQMISAYKSTINGKSGASGKSVARGVSGGNVSINDVVAVRELLDRVGVDQLNKLVKALC